VLQKVPDSQPFVYLENKLCTPLSYIYFAITQRQFLPTAIYDHIVESKKRKNYQASGFDMEKYEGLIK